MVDGRERAFRISINGRLEGLRACEPIETVFRVRLSPRAVTISGTYF